MYSYEERIRAVNLYIKLAIHSSMAKRKEGESAVSSARRSLTCAIACPMFTRSSGAPASNDSSYDNADFATPLFSLHYRAWREIAFIQAGRVQDRCRAMRRGDPWRSWKHQYRPSTPRTHSSKIDKKPCQIPFVGFQKKVMLNRYKDRTSGCHQTPRWANSSIP